MATPGTCIQQNIPVVEATLANVDSMSSIVPRAFHPNNAFMRKCLPDTPAMSQWWSHVFSTALKNPNTHILTALDHSSTSTTPLAIGVLVCSFMDAHETGGGIFDSTPIRPKDDHDREMYGHMVQTMVSHRERLMLGSRHLCVEMFGVDKRYQGTGVGMRLLQHACALADEEQLKAFVQANEYARTFYERQGFVVDEVVVLPGEHKYKEYLLVRPIQERV